MSSESFRGLFLPLKIAKNGCSKILTSGIAFIDWLFSLGPYITAFEAKSIPNRIFNDSAGLEKFDQSERKIYLKASVIKWTKK